ncbi:MAG: YjiH family protein [Desulfobacter sp.]|nr:MAG: YjiH family protein [Desulfobacter sp.]
MEEALKKGETRARSVKGTAALKSIAGSLLGIILFFIPFSTASGESKIPLIMIIDFIKGSLGKGLEYLTLGVVLLLFSTWVLSRTTQIPMFKKYHEKDGILNGIFFGLAAVFSVMIVFKIGPEWLLHKDIGGLAFHIGCSVLLTVSFAGTLVMFLTEFGFLEFVGTLMAPLMRPVYRLPGRSAVDAVTSFVADPAVGIFITNKIYKNGYYTQRESASIATNFSICSLGFFALLTSIGGIMEYLPHVIITSFIVTFIIAAIVTRVPPLSTKRDVYIDGREQTDEMRKPVPLSKKIISEAAEIAVDKAAAAKPAMFSKGALDAVKFAQKIVGYVVSIATLALILAEYTPVFDWLGVPVSPILELLGLPDAKAIGSTVLVSITEIALPIIIASGAKVSTMSLFFVCTLSTVQVIFFTESANAMLEADIPLTVWELVAIFFIRTIVAVPLVAIAAHIIF